MSLVAFRKIGIGKEATRGTKVAADKKLLGALTMNPNITYHRPSDERGSLADFSRAIAIAQGCTLRFTGDATYDQIIYFLAMCVQGGVTPTQPDNVNAPNLYAWDFTPNQTAVDVKDSFTFEYGDDTQEWESGFVVATNLELSFALNQVVAFNADLIGQFPAKATFTSLSDPSKYNEIVANKMDVYVDSAWANLGTTKKNALVAGATVRLATGITPVKHADASLDFSTVSEQKRHLELDLDLVVGSDMVTEYDAWVANTLRAIRLEIIGPASGTLFFQLLIDIIGKYTSEPTFFRDNNGENIVSLTLSSEEDSTPNEYAFNVRNEESAL